jgi:hypothetical protein
MGWDSRRLLYPEVGHAVRNDLDELLAFEERTRAEALDRLKACSAMAAR